MRDPPWLDPLLWAGRELLQPEHALPAGREMVGGGAAHAAEADHDDVVSPCRLRYLLIRAISGSTTGSACTVAESGAAVVDCDGVADLGGCRQPRVRDRSDRRWPNTPRW